MSEFCEQGADRGGALTSGSVGSKLISLAWPILSCGIVGVLDASVNVIWVGRELGDVSLAALSNANLLWVMLFVGALGISMAGTVWIGQRLGKGDIAGAKEAVGTMVTASIAISWVCVLPMMAWTHGLLACLGTPAVARGQAVEYLRVLLLSVPPNYLNVVVMASLQAAGDARTGFYLALISVAVDAALNPLLIIGISPFPALGIAGSAVATFGSQAILLIALLRQIYKSGHPLRILRGDLGLLRLEWARVAALLRCGGPMAVQVLWTSVEQMLMISLVNRFGADVTAAYGAVVQLWNIIMMPAGALGAAITAIVAQNVGAGRWDRVRSASRLGVTYGVFATAVLVALSEVFDARMCEVFLRPRSPALAYAVEINREVTWSLILLGGYMVWVGVLRATGAIWAPLAISVGVLAVRFPVTAALLGRWHMQAIWWSFPASAAATTLFAALHASLGPRAQRALLGSG